LFAWIGLRGGSAATSCRVQAALPRNSRNHEHLASSIDCIVLVLKRVN
jgi:hypothetical protein